IDLVQQGVLQGGELAGLVQLRDTILVEMQNQLDDIAAGLASVFSTITTSGEALPGATGFTADISGIKPGNDILVTYAENGVEHRLRIVNGKTPEKYPDASGHRVIVADFGDPPNATALAAALGAVAPELDFSATADGELTILDKGGRDV